MLSFFHSGLNPKKNLRVNLVIIVLTALLLGACSKTEVPGQTYYINNLAGDDNNDGLKPATAWKTLEKASKEIYKPGDKLLLCNGCTFNGKLVLNGGGSENNPVIVSDYNLGEGNGKIPIIDAKGYEAAIHISNGKYFRISNLELTADAGDPLEPEARTKRYGIRITAELPGKYPGIHMKNLKIHDIFASENVKGDGQNPTSNMGYGIYIGMANKDALISNIRIEECSIEMTGHTGIRIFGTGNYTGSTYLDSVSIINNQLTNIGGPGMVPGRCQNVLVRGNVVNYSGSSADPRMHNRGSGIWPWTCNNVLIEKNKFMNAWGKKDSYGAHIDYNCNNVVVQYNMSINNSGGFVEILGNNNNCCYRYNISINDGYRQRGVKGVVQDGKILWTSGFVGSNTRTGPFNSYIYNNTIFIKEEYPARFSYTNTTNGLLIAKLFLVIQIMKTNPLLLV